MIIPYRDMVPMIGSDVFVAPDAWVIGDVTLGDQVSLFFGAVLRGDFLSISVGRGTNIQEHALLHTTIGRTPTVVGEEVTVGHRAIVHGATVGNRCIIGMGATLLDEAVVEDECIIAAGSLLTSNKRIAARSLVMGVPAKVVRSLTDEEISYIKQTADHYIIAGKDYIEMNLDR